MSPSQLSSQVNITQLVKHVGRPHIDKSTQPHSDMSTSMAKKHCHLITRVLTSDPCVSPLCFSPAQWSSLIQSPYNKCTTFTEAQHISSPLKSSLFFSTSMAQILRGIVRDLLCASRMSRKSQSQRKREERVMKSGEQKLLSKINSNISSKAQLMVKLISWRKVEAEEELDDGEEIVWRKTIMMGERCRPLDFSGRILYDSEGNLLPDPDCRK
ncbi:hypothetical protein SLE2022_188200 [Rubroshorea leprosula]